MEDRYTYSDLADYREALDVWIALEDLSIGAGGQRPRFVPAQTVLENVTVPLPVPVALPDVTRTLPDVSSFVRSPEPTVGGRWRGRPSDGAPRFRSVSSRSINQSKPMARGSLVRLGDRPRVKRAERYVLPGWSAWESWERRNAGTSPAEYAASRPR